MIHFYQENIQAPVLPKRKLIKWITQVAKNEGFEYGEISFIFCNDEKILEVNRQFLNHDYYTDIITFDNTEGKKISGDIYISIDTVSSNATQFGTSFENELFRVIIHGILHLCGQNDRTDDEKNAMTTKENFALTLLNEI